MVSFDFNIVPKRIMIIGCCGAGKSTLAHQLQDRTGLPIVILDEHYYSKNWTEPSKADWNKTAVSLAQRPEYIMDGNYGSSMHLRLPHADMIIFLDHPTHRLLFRVLSRTYKNWGKTRPGMPAGCPERFNMKFIHYVTTFNTTRRKDLIERIHKYAPEIPFYRLRGQDEINTFLTCFSATQHAIKT